MEVLLNALVLDCRMNIPADRPSTAEVTNRVVDAMHGGDAWQYGREKLLELCFIGAGAFGEVKKVWHIAGKERVPCANPNDRKLRCRLRGRGGAAAAGVGRQLTAFANQNLSAPPFLRWLLSTLVTAPGQPLWRSR